MFEQAGQSQRYGGPPFAGIEILLGSIGLPHEHVGEDDGLVDRGTVLGRDNENRRTFDQRIRRNVGCCYDTPPLPLEILDGDYRSVKRDQGHGPMLHVGGGNSSILRMSGLSK